jgi:CBS domain-containing protein
MQVSHVMRRDVVTITADQTLQNAAATMRLFDVGVLSVEEGNKLIGMVTERDIAIRGIADGMGPDAKVRDVMTYEVKCCFEDEDIGHVVENMAELRERCLPVINRDKRPVGSVSIGDLAKEALLVKTGSVLQGIPLPGGGGRRHNQGPTATG